MPESLMMIGAFLAGGAMRLYKEYRRRALFDIALNARFNREESAELKEMLGAQPFPGLLLFWLILVIPSRRLVRRLVIRLRHALDDYRARGRG
jgi:hypothetical protein